MCAKGLSRKGNQWSRPFRARESHTESARCGQRGREVFKACGVECGEEGMAMQALGNTPAEQLKYYCYGVGCSEVELDSLTGEVEILRADIVYDAVSNILK